jgi:glutaconate CoA-transferase subunit A
VDALVEVPYGAFPHECHGLYEADFSHFDIYVDPIRTRGETAVREYLDRYVFGTKNHQEYLDLFGKEVIERQSRYAQELVGKK